VLVDGAAYFDAFREAAKRATRTIFVIGWDIDSRTRLVRGTTADGWPETLGELLEAVVAARPELHAYVLDWDFAMLYALDREVLPIFKLGWRTHRRLHFHLDDQHPIGASHHQKIVVIDDTLAFVGGLDLTKGRWDTPAHRVDEPGRVAPDGERYAPFHDLQLMVDGDTARALGELARSRWERATGRQPIGGGGQKTDPWPPSIAPDIEDVDVGIARTLPPHAGTPGVAEVKALHVDAIASARRTIYVENQYLTSPVIGEAIARRLAEPDGPEIVIVSRRGGSDWLETQTMSARRSQLLERLRSADPHGRLRVYYPRVAGLDAPVKVHSKLMIVDDRFLRAGSANLNNRSMGLDSECDIALEGDAPAVRQRIAGIRDRLLAEHLGVDAERVAAEVARRGSLIAAIETLHGGPRTLDALEPPPMRGLDALVPEVVSEVDILDPERPVDPDVLADQFVPSEGRTGAGRRIAAWVAIVLAIAGLAAAWRWTALSEWLDPGALARYADLLRSSTLAPLWVLGVYVVASLVAFPITVLIVGTAAFFGPLAAFAYALAGVVGGGAVGFVVGHWLGRDAVRRIAGARINRLSRRLARRGILTIVAVRIVPVAPFTVVNLVAGASHIRFRDFAVGTLLGMCPGILAITVFSDRVVAAVRDPAPESIALLGLVAGAISVGALLLRRWLKRRADTSAEGGKPQQGRA